MIVKGLFDDGSLTEVEEFVYPDGLTIRYPKIDLSAGKPDVDLSQWRYLKNEDRRYCGELKQAELEAVGPHSFLTSVRPARELEAHSYDTEEGIYKPHSGFIWNISSPYAHVRHVSCKAEQKHIIKNYRKGPSPLITEEDRNLFKDEPSVEVGRRILQANLTASQELEGRKACVCKDRADRDRYFNRICEMEERDLHSASSCDGISHYSAEMHAVFNEDFSSSKDNSFSDVPVHVDIRDICEKGPADTSLKPYNIGTHESIFQTRRNTDTLNVVSEIESIGLLMQSFRPVTHNTI